MAPVKRINIMISKFVLQSLCGLVFATTAHSVSTGSLGDCVEYYIDADLDQAAECLEAYSAEYPHHTAARNLWAAVQLLRQQPLRVAAILPEALARDDAQAAALRGTALLRSGADLEGFEWLQYAVAAGEPEGLYRLVLTEAQNGPAAPLVIMDLRDEVLPTDLLKPLWLLQEQAFGQATALIAGQLERQPESPLYLYLLGLAYSEQRDYQYAHTALSRALERQPQLLSAHLGIAGIALATGDLEAARAHYMNVLEVRENHIDALSGLVKIAQHGGQSAQVRQWLESSWQRDGEAQIGSLLVQALLADEAPDIALEIATLLRQQYADQPEPLYAHGLALLANDHYSAAVDTLQTLTDLQPHDVETWKLLASAQIQKDDLQAAMLALNQAVSLAPDHLAVRVIRAEVYLLSEQFQAALDEALAIQSIAPEQAVGYKLEGDVYMQRGEYAAAVEVYQVAFEHEPTAETVLLLNSAHWLDGNPIEAMSILRRWTAIAPENTMVRLQLAMQLQQLGDIHNAREEYKQLLKLAPQNLIALNNLAWLYLDYDPQHSVELAEQALALAPERGEVADTLGWALVQTDQSERAVEVLQRAAAAAGHIPQIRYHLAVAQYHAGDLESARGVLATLMDESLPPNLRQEVDQLVARLDNG